METTMNKEELLEFVVKHFRETTKIFEDMKMAMDTVLFLALVQESLQENAGQVTPEMKADAVVDAGKKLGKLKVAIQARRDNLVKPLKELDARGLDPNNPKTEKGKIGFI